MTARTRTHTHACGTNIHCFCHLVGQRDLVISCCGLPGVYLITQAVKHNAKTNANSNCENCNNAVAGAKGERSTAHWHVRLIKRLIYGYSAVSTRLARLYACSITNGLLSKRGPSSLVVVAGTFCAAVEEKRARCVQSENCLSARTACCFYKLPPTDCRHSIQNTTCCKPTCNPKQNFQTRTAQAPRQGNFIAALRSLCNLANTQTISFFTLQISIGWKVDKVAMWQGCDARMFDTQLPIAEGRVWNASILFWLHGECGACSLHLPARGYSGISSNIA